MSFRTTLEERDFSGFVSAVPGETGAMLVLSQKGPNTPVKLEGEQDVLDLFGNPSSIYPSVFDLVEFARRFPVWGVSAYASDALWGGVDVKSTGITAFGARSGRNIDTFAYATANNNAAETAVGVVNGINDVFAGTLANSPVTGGSLQLKVAGTTLAATESGGTITGADVDSGSLVLASGVYTVNLAGAPGTVASYKTKVDLTGGINLATVATAGVATLSSAPTQFVGAVVPGIPAATYDININVDGGGVDLLAVAITVVDDWNTIAGKIQTALQAATVSTETVTISSGQIRVTSAITGASSTIVIAAGTFGSPGGDLLAAIALLAGHTAVIDVPVNGQNAGISVKIDTGAVVNVDLGALAVTSRAVIRAAIDAAVGAAVTADNNTGGAFIDILGQIGSATFGDIQIDSPTGSTLQDAVVASIDATFTGATINEAVASVNPTGSIPLVNQIVTLDYTYTTNDSLITSHSFFARSPYSPGDLALEIEHTGGGTTDDYHVKLFKVVSTGNLFIEEFDYSLIKKQDNFGVSLFIEDVFLDNKWVIPKVNSAFVGIAAPTKATVAMTGGSRGGTIQASDKLAAWQNFQKPNKYRAKIFMDSLAESSTVLTIRDNFQKFSIVLSMIPLGNDAAAAILYRNGLGIDNDQITLQTNWSKIKDPYNNSTALVSRMGALGVKYGQMQNVFDALSPAGVNENDHGGQLEGFDVIEMEQDYSDSELASLDNAQINPIIQDELYGPISMGDRTLQVSLSDTSYVGTRRLYNFLAETLINQVLRRQEFKNNDRFHRDRAKSLSEEFIQPILNGEFLREAFVQCDDKNNNNIVLNQRKFILDIFVKVTPNSQKVLLRLTRLSQTAILADFIIQ